MRKTKQQLEEELKNAIETIDVLDGEVRRSRILQQINEICMSITDTSKLRKFLLFLSVSTGTSICLSDAKIANQR